MTTTNPMSEATSSANAIHSLIEGKILPEAKLFITSHYHAVSKLVNQVDRCLELEGFNKDKLEEFCSTQLDGDLVKMVMEYLDQHPRILGLCYIPCHAECFI